MPKNISRRKTLVSVGLTGLASLSGCIGGTDDEDDQINIKHAIQFEGIATERVFEQVFLDKVVEYTDGRVQYEAVPSQSLGGPGEVHNLVQAQTVQTGLVSPPYTSDIFPYDSVAELPGFDADYADEVNAYWELVKPEGGTIYEKSYAPRDLRSLAVLLNPPYQVLTKETQIAKKEDFEGLTLRTSGLGNLTASLLGATGVSIEGGETYSALERGTIDGILWPFNGSIMAFGLEDHLGFSTLNLNLASFTHNICVNEDVYQDWPEDIQDAVVRAGRDTTDEAIGSFQNLRDDEVGELEDAGIEFTELADSDVEEIHSSLEPVQDAWVDGRGSFGQEVLDEYLSLIE